jgi:hypothetical protein
LGLALLLVGSQSVGAQQGGFGTLETANEAAVKAKAAAWLKEAGKTDAATLERFEALWNQKERTVTDRLGETFALGNDAAAKLLAAARNPKSLPLAQVPEVISAEGQSVFFRANLGLAYASIVSNRGGYDESLAVLKLFTPEQTVEPSAFLFRRAVSEFKLLKKDDATKSITRLLEDAVDAPERYITVALLMSLDMHTWKDKDLGAIARQMKRIEERIDLAKIGNETQKQQKQVVLRLEEIIKEMENKTKKKDGPPQDGPPKDGQPMPGEGGPDGDCPSGQGDGDGPPMKNDPNSDGAKESGLPNLPPASGKVDQVEVKKLKEQWFSLPAREREQKLNELTIGMTPAHRQAIENYFRNLLPTSSRPRTDGTRR